MGLNLKYADGQTPLDEDEKEGLKINSITTQKELDEFEQLNIEKAVEWTIHTNLKPEKILTEKFIKDLHKKMYGDVWKWAGEFRKSDKNIGINWTQIGIEVSDGFVFVELIENTDFNIGRNKVYYGVAGNLFAFACKESWDKGDFGYVAFNSKTNLIGHYETLLGAKKVGNSNQMIIEPKVALKLIQQYYKE